MPTIHPTAIVQGPADLADDVEIGPNCVVTGPVRLGPGTRLVGNVYVEGPLEMGRDNVVYPFACLGFAPQHARFDPRTPGLGTVIGDGNTIREHVTIHRAFTDEGPTRVGDRNWFMVGSHVGHDSRVADDCTFVNGALLGGHVTVGERVVIGGGATIHQFCRIGRGVMISGGGGASVDVPPYLMISEINMCVGPNLVGLRRRGMPREDVEMVKWVYRTIWRQGTSLGTALEQIRARAGHPIVDEYLEFIEGSKRGICSSPGQASRGRKALTGAAATPPAPAPTGTLPAGC